MADKNLLDEEQLQRLRDDLLDTLDEELEMSIDEEGNPTDRVTYFRELLRLQGELVKLQDWVVATKQKVVILFEGRDAAGKGGVIKRITQRLNPRVCRVAALPAPTTANAHSGISNGMWRTCPQLEKLCCLTAAGTTARAWSA